MELYTNQGRFVFLSLIIIVVKNFTPYITLDALMKSRKPAQIQSWRLVWVQDKRKLKPPVNNKYNHNLHIHMKEVC